MTSQLTVGLAEAFECESESKAKAFSSLSTEVTFLSVSHLSDFYDFMSIITVIFLSVLNTGYIKHNGRSMHYNIDQPLADPMTHWNYSPIICIRNQKCMKKCKKQKQKIQK